MFILSTSGETAFKTMTLPFGWAKNCMATRIVAADKDLSVSFVYGSRSWIDNSSGYTVKENRLESNTEIIVCLICFLVNFEFI